MMTVLERTAASVDPGSMHPEVAMVGKERWQEIHRLFRAERIPVAEIARQLPGIGGP